ncbi:MAG TPA: hypothetical protein VHT27_01325 [Solirubrobacteraceae bacterium]|jgi:hypothetical protein|nr:hypothetical protein [Solirubrobacteraceae bacterium]
MRWLGAAALAIAAIGAVPAHAASAGTETFTEHEHGVTLQEELTLNPCTGEPGELVAVAKNFKIHVTHQEDGNAWVTGTGNGSASFTPLAPEGVSYSGHFTVWFGESLNNKNKVEHSTQTYVLTGTDGSTVHVKMLYHLSTNAKGEVTAQTENGGFRCG